MGFKVKMDTNGSKPFVLRELIEENLIDYAALDFKALPSTFQKITQSNLFIEFEKSLELLLNAHIIFEVRTTVHSDLIDENDFLKMIDYLEKIGYEGNYYIQHFINDVNTLALLGYSHKQLRTKDFSTPKIQVIFRDN